MCQVYVSVAASTNSIRPYLGIDRYFFYNFKQYLYFSDDARSRILVILIMVQISDIYSGWSKKCFVTTCT